MDFRRHVARLLHDEHVAALAVLGRLDGLLRSHRESRAPPAASGEVKLLLGALTAAITGEIGPHFRFEEDQLFPLLAARGEADIGALLAEEHGEILPPVLRIAELAATARSDGFDDRSWAEFRTLGGETIERLTSHIQKEEMALLPLLDELLEDEDDSRLAEIHLTTR